MKTRTKLTVSDAVNAFDVERRTLQRLLAANQFDGAYKDTRGRWMIPIEALHAAGFTARKTWIPDATTDATKSTTRHDTDAPPTRQTAEKQHKSNTTSGTTSATDSATQRDSDATDLRHRIAQLEDQLDTEKRLREAAERNSDDLRSALRMLEAGRPQPATQTSGPTPSRRRWWQRS